MNIDDIKREIYYLQTEICKKATVFDTGGIRPTKELNESWIGCITFKNEDEEYPINHNGNKMIPLATIFLDKLEYVPEELENFKLITIYMDDQVFNNMSNDNLIEYFKINTYKSLDNLVSCNYESDSIKPFPLVPKVIDDDCPMWEDLSWNNEDLEKRILKLEDISDNYSYFDAIFIDNHSKHKLGGCPSYCQSGFDYGDGYEYVLQISSDEKADFNIIDSGNFYFGYNKKLDKWSVFCDFY